MTLILNHTIVGAHDRNAAAAFFGRLVDRAPGEPAGPFVPVRVNDDLTLDFDDRSPVAASHFGFLVDDQTFDALLTRLDGVKFGSGPEHGWDGRINHLAGGRGVYVGSPEGHTYEFFTAVPPVS